MVFYRKYRPQTIEQLDSTQVRDTLRSILSAQEIPHAFIFTGPKGLGKTSTARIVAKVVNCERRASSTKLLATSKSKKPEARSQKLEAASSIEPCNECEQCVSITKGTNLDVMEIDGASNRGIDEIRDLREKLRLAPLSARKKVYIIDEVHMLTTEAFNALLKTLEEPPAHVMFVLCTTEPQKVPATILSRCHHVAFPKATSEELVRSFTRIVHAEGLKADEDALLSIAQLSDGGFRDGTKILEELSLFATDKKITKEIVEDKYKVASSVQYVSEMIESLERKETKQSIEIVSKISEQGIDIKYFIEQLVGFTHGLLLGKVGVGIENVTTKMSIDELKKLLELLTRAYAETKYAVITQLPLEIAIIEYSFCDKREEISNKQETMGTTKQVQNHRDKKEENIKTSYKAVVGNEKREFNLREQFIDMAKKENQTIAGLLRSCLIVQEKGEIIINAKFPFHKEKLEEKKAFTVLEKIAKDIIGKKVQIQVQLQGE